MRRKAKAKKTTRIYYNEPGMPPLFWRVNVTDARKSVQIDSSLKDALMGTPGSTVGCHLSLCATRNKLKFPHPVIMVAVTKTAALLIDQLKDGQPYHAWRYVHRCGALVDLNDTDKTKRVIKKMPRLAERSLTFYAPYKNPPRADGHAAGKTAGNIGNVVGPKSPRLARGALRRAVKAGLVSAPIAEALSLQVTG